MALGDYLDGRREVDPLLEEGPTLRVLRAGVRSLAECLPAAVAARMAAGLPPVLGREARTAARQDQGLAGFMDRFVRRSGVRAADALRDVRIVLRILGGLLPSETMLAVRASLPEGFEELFRRRS